jgi:hypothetical protein
MFSWWQQRKKDRALITAVQKGDLEEVVRWADRGANIKCKCIALRDGSVRSNPLLEAILYSHASIVQYILDRESSLIYQKDRRGFTPFHRAILRYDIDIDILRILLREQDFISKDLVNSCRKGGHSILVDVVNSYRYFEHIDETITSHWMGKLCLLLDAEGIDVNTTTNNDGWTALHIAWADMSFEMIGALIKSPGIRIDIKTSCKGYTALDLLLKKRDSNRCPHLEPKYEEAIALFNMKKC